MKSNNYQNVLSSRKVKQVAKSLLVASIVASQVFTVLPTGSFAAEKTSATTSTESKAIVPSAESVAKTIKPVTTSLALDGGVTEVRTKVSTFAQFKAAVESKTANVIELTGSFQFTSNVTVDSNMRIEGNGNSISLASYQVIMKSSSIIDIQDAVLSNTGSLPMFTGFNGNSTPTLNIIDNVQVRGYIMAGVGNLSMSIDGSNNRFVSDVNTAIDVNELEIKNGARIEQLEARNSAIHIRDTGSASIGADTYINMKSNQGYAFDAWYSSLVVGENAVIKSSSKYGTLRASTLVVKNGADLSLASGDEGYGIYSTGNITIGDNVKLKATGTGTAVYAVNTGTSIVVGKNADIDIVSDNGYGFYSNGKITFGDGSALKLRTQLMSFYVPGSGGVQFGSVSNQSQPAEEKVKIDIDSALEYGIYSFGPVMFGDNTDVSVKSRYTSVYAVGTARVNIGSHSKATFTSSSQQGIYSGGTTIGDNADVSIKSYGRGIDNTDLNGQGLSTGNQTSLKIVSSTQDALITYNNVNFGNENIIDFSALSGRAIHTYYGKTVKIGSDSTAYLSGKSGLYQEGLSSSFNAGTGTSLKIDSAEDGIWTAGSTTFAANTKLNIRAASSYGDNSAIRSAGVVTFNKDSMIYAETLSNNSTAIFDLSSNQNTRLVLNSPKYIDFRQNSRDTSTKTSGKNGHIIKGYGNDSDDYKTRVEINNMDKLYAWNQDADWSKAPTGTWNEVDSVKIPLSLRAGSQIVNFFGGVATGKNIEGFSIFDYSRVSTEASNTIDRPGIDTVYTTSKTVTGTAVPGNEIVLTLPDGTKLKTTVKTDGTWSINVPSGIVLTKNQTISAYQTNGVNDSVTTNTKVIEDLRTPEAPTANKVKEGDTKVTGKGEPITDITITLPDGTKVKGKTDDKGDFTITIPAQKEGAEIKVTQTGPNGKESDPTNVIVASNQKPVITASDKSIKVGDTFNPLTGVTASDKEDGNLTSKIIVTKNTVNTAKEGTYQVTYSVTDSDKNTTTKTINVKVEDLTGSITTDTFYLGVDNYINGTFNGKVAKVRLKVNGSEFTLINVADGKFTYYAKDKITSITDKAEIVAYNANGTVIETKTVKIIDGATLTGKVTPAVFKLGSDLRVTGTYTGNVKKVALSVNGVVTSSVSVIDGTTFQYYAKDLIKNLTDDVKVIGYNATGAAVSTVKVTIQNSSENTGSITANDFAIGSDLRVTGTYTGGVKRVALQVNGETFTGVSVAADGTFQYYAKDKILSKTDVVKVLAYNASGDLIKTVTVKLTDSAALQGSITANDFAIGTDLRVTGTYTGGVKRVALQVNGETFTGVGVAADGTFQYYAKDKILNKTDVVKVLAYNVNGDLIKTVTVKLTDSAALQGSITTNKFEIGTDLRVTGTYTGGVKKVALQVNGETFTGVGVATDGTFTYYAKDKILNKADEVKVLAYNANNQVVDTKTVTVTDSSSNVESKVIPATFKIGDARVTGTQTGAVKKVGLEINGTVHAYVPVLDATTFQYYAKNLILNDTDQVYVIGYDSANQQVAKSKVTVIK
ncbi:DUF5011 domain-containing protein [Listeria booriae]|uniref:immunoglobulin-like domain-containing protein n=1 Tax=Listeria booriae TaxID=1552123 RepID=UPI0016251902|nr:immunoglobulin-like domain-containing protein [Listeria booriae]MBC1813661.1 DUF5011 domain-containing protein [Listeria booriae]